MGTIEIDIFRIHARGNEILVLCNELKDGIDLVSEKLSTPITKIERIGTATCSRKIQAIIEAGKSSLVNIKNATSHDTKEAINILLLKLDPYEADRLMARIISLRPMAPEAGRISEPARDDLIEAARRFMEGPAQ